MAERPPSHLGANDRDGLLPRAAFAGGASSGFFASGGVFAFIAFLASIAWVAAVSVVFLRSGGAAPVAT